MNSSSLRKWKVLDRLTDEELDNIVYLHVYGGHDRNPGQELSALFITRQSKVYGVGLNSLIGLGITVLPIAKPIQANKVANSFSKYSKVSPLSGEGITKIIVGSTFGAALTKNGAVYVWGCIGRPAMAKVNDEDVVMHELYKANVQCKICGNCYIEGKIGPISVSRCSNITEEKIVRVSYNRSFCDNYYPTYTKDSPPPHGTKVVKFIKFADNSVMCPKCKRFCSSKKVNNSDLHYCVECKTPLEVTNDTRVLLGKSHFLAPHRLEVCASWKVTNMYSGSTFLVIETLTGRLFLWGVIRDSVYKSYVFNPDNIRFKSVSCGGSHLAVISSRGELYTCGLGDVGQLGYEWTADMGHMTLRKVPLNGSVVKVCCGYSSTACLMSNGSIMCFGSNMKKLSSGIICLSCPDSKFITAPTNILESIRFTDIVNAPLTNVFCAKSEDSEVFVWGKSKSPHPELCLGGSELSDALVDLPYTYVFTSGSTEPEPEISLPPITQEHEHLYGNKLFSDLTLHLADGDFPVHRLVLHSNSSYFKELLCKKGGTPDVLDMSHYNPTSYKSLLKYFYQVPLEDLNCEDLFDLYSIAVSYKENNLVASTFNRLKAMINEDTVLKLHTKAKSTSAEVLLKECELFLSSPEFKNKLFSYVSQDMEKTIAILRMNNDK